MVMQWGERGQRAEACRESPGRISFFSSPSVFSWRKYPLKLMPGSQALPGSSSIGAEVCVFNRGLAYICPIAVEAAQGGPREGWEPGQHHPRGLAVPL